MNQNNKGQITMEFVVAFSMVLLVFVTGIFIYAQRNEMNIISEERWQAQKTADNLARVINVVYLSDDNFSYTEYINWKAGSIEVESGSIRVFGIGGAFYDSYIIPESVEWLVTNQDGYVVCSRTGGKVKCQNA